MVTEDLLRYIEHSLEQGETVPDVAKRLIEQGWSPEDIDAALSVLIPSSPPPAPQPVGTVSLSPVMVGGIVAGNVIALMLLAYAGVNLYGLFNNPGADVLSSDTNVPTEEEVLIPVETVDYNEGGVDFVEQQEWSDVESEPEPEPVRFPDPEPDSLEPEPELVNDPDPEPDWYVDSEPEVSLEVEDMSADEFFEEIFTIPEGTYERDLAIATALRACQNNFSQSYSMSLFGEEFDLERTVLGLIDGRCHYEETMPFSTYMYCMFPQDHLSDMADSKATIAQAYLDGKRVSQGVRMSTEPVTIVIGEDYDPNEPISIGGSSESYFAIDGGTEQIDHYGTAINDTDICTITQGEV